MTSRSPGDDAAERRRRLEARAAAIEPNPFDEVEERVGPVIKMQAVRRLVASPPRGGASAGAVAPADLWSVELDLASRKHLTSQLSLAYLLVPVPALGGDAAHAPRISLDFDEADRARLVTPLDAVELVCERWEAALVLHAQAQRDEAAEREAAVAAAAQARAEAERPAREFAERRPTLLSVVPAAYPASLPPAAGAAAAPLHRLALGLNLMLGAQRDLAEEYLRGVPVAGPRPGAVLTLRTTWEARALNEAEAHLFEALAQRTDASRAAQAAAFRGHGAVEALLGVLAEVARYHDERGHEDDAGAGMAALHPRVLAAIVAGDVALAEAQGLLLDAYDAVRGDDAVAAEAPRAPLAALVALEGALRPLVLASLDDRAAALAALEAAVARARAVQAARPELAGGAFALGSAVREASAVAVRLRRAHDRGEPTAPALDDDVAAAHATAVAVLNCAAEVAASLGLPSLPRPASGDAN